MYSKRNRALIIRFYLSIYLAHSQLIIGWTTPPLPTVVCSVVVEFACWATSDYSLRRVSLSIECILYLSHFHMLIIVLLLSLIITQIITIKSIWRAVFVLFSHRDQTSWVTTRTMAGNVVVRKLEKITPPQVLLDGMTLWKWEEVRRNVNGLLHL